MTIERERGRGREREERERNSKYYCIREVIRKTERVRRIKICSKELGKVFHRQYV